MAINYQLLIDKAMLGVVQEVLTDLQEQGFSADHCFYISFRTDDPEVVISRHVKVLYPKEITIILQHQYKNLQVLEDSFSVNIAFGGIPETIEVPFAALTGFVDPTVNFSLQFKHGRKNNKPSINDVKESPKIIEKKPERKAGEVIVLDKFRKKPKQ